MHAATSTCLFQNVSDNKIMATTYRIEVEAVRKGDGADGQRAKVMGRFTTESAGEKYSLTCSFYHFAQW